MGYFNLNVFKSPILQPNERWVNTYTLNIPEAEVADEISADVWQAFVDYEAAFLLELHQIVQTTISTWQPDSTPYNPVSFVTTPYQEPGLRDATGEKPLSLRDVFYVRRKTTSGNNGKLFYRGVLYMDDVTNATGTYALDPASTVIAAFETAFSALVVELGTLTVQMVMITHEIADVRPVPDLEIAGVRSVSRNHRWYNQTT